MITVVRAAPFVTVQDLGRPGHAALGLPAGGALDRLALAVGNALVGNPAGAAALEWGVGAGEIRFERDTRLALTGATPRALLDGRRAAGYETLLARTGSLLGIEGVADGAWLYIAVGGGIVVPPVLGSRATYLPARLGGLGGRFLVSGDRLPVGRPERVPPPGLRAPDDLMLPGGTDLIGILPGPERPAAGDAGWRRVLEAEFRIAAVSRMGYRLEGPRLTLDLPPELASAPTCPGTVQAPAGGTPIVLMPDGPTVGGYPRLAVVATAELGRLAQRRPGNTVRFRELAIEEARAALAAQGRALERLAAEVA
jgi:antagonist of KipI